MDDHPALSEAELAELDERLAALPESLDTLDLCALDGFLCGVLLQPRPVAPADWLPRVVDLDGRPAPPGHDLPRLQALVRRRHAELERAISARQWFDPWVFELEEGDDAADDAGDDVADAGATQDGPRAAVLPWVAGFAAAMDLFPGLMALDHPGLVEPLALIYAAFDPDDLEDADDLLAVIDTLEPPSDMAEAVEDLVRAVLLLADVSRPRREAPRGARRPGPPRGPGRGGRGPAGGRSGSAPRRGRQA